MRQKSSCSQRFSCERGHALSGSLEDTKRKKKKKVCIGVPRLTRMRGDSIWMAEVILELGDSETNVKYEASW